MFEISFFHPKNVRFFNSKLGWVADTDWTINRLWPNDKALQTFSSRAFSVMLAGTGFNSIVSLLLYWEYATALHSNCIILDIRYELNFLHCCNSELTVSYFDTNSLNISSRLLSFVLMSLMKLELISVSFWMSSSLLIFSNWLPVKTILKFNILIRVKIS